MLLSNSLIKACGAALALTGFAGLAQAQSNWVNWVDETATRVSPSNSFILTDTQEKDMVAGDFDRDGDDDLVIARKLPFSVAGADTNALFMNESGVLTDRTSTLAPSFLIPTDDRDVLVFDANGDGWMDLVNATTFSENPRLWINQGETAGSWNGFAESLNWFSPAFPVGPKFCAVYEGDVDNDGDMDLYFSDYNNTLEDQLLINDGSGVFTNETTTRFPTGINNSVFGTGSFVCDFNLDGWNDILKVSGSFEPAKLLINGGAGSPGIFTQMQVLDSTTLYMARAADYNNDGRTDIFMISDNQDYQLINNSTNPDGTVDFTRINVTNSNNTLNFGGNVKAADLDLDGYLDIGVADVDVDIPGCTRNFCALRNKMGLTSSDGMDDPNNPVNLAWNNSGVHDLVFMDVNGDGYKDMVHGLCSGFRVWIMEPYDVPGINYCTATVNSTGAAAKIKKAGSNSIANNAMRLTTSPVPPSDTGLVIYGLGRTQLPIGNGNLCVGFDELGFLVRGPGGFSSPSGSATFLIDLQTPLVPLALITPGSTWNFAYWYRDHDAGGSEFNFSDGIEILFQP